MDGGCTIRPARDEDAAALAAIYRPFVEATSVSFEIEPPSEDAFRERVRAFGDSHAWLVAEVGGRPVGYAYGSPHRPRAAYRWTAEVSAYVAPDSHRSGLGRRLYEQLFDRLADRGFCTALAIVTLPNEGSVAFHRRMGFAPVGVFPRAGRKFGRWHDVLWLSRRLRDEPPHEPDQAGGRRANSP